VVALIAGQCLARNRSERAVYLTVVIAPRLQRGLNSRNERERMSRAFTSSTALGRGQSLYVLNVPEFYFGLGFHRSGAVTLESV